MKKLFLFTFIAGAITGCSSMQNTSGSKSVTLTGSLQKMGITTYQYGTHTINSGGKPYALKSSSLNLDTYLDKQVSLKGTKVSGYPVEGGPELIEVSEVIVK